MVFEYVETIRNKANTKTLGYKLKTQSGYTEILTSEQIKEILSTKNLILGIHLGKSNQIITTRKHIQFLSSTISSKVTLETGHDLKHNRSRVTRGITQRRNFVTDLEKSLADNSQPERISLISGIRRTGKTVGLSQCVLDLINKGTPSTHIAFLTIENNQDTSKVLTSSELLAILSNLIANGIKYIFIDEITAIPGIVITLKQIADQYCIHSKIIITGTDSYVFPLSLRDSLIGRARFFNTTLMFFPEYERVMLATGTLSSTDKILNFVRFGGVTQPSEYDTLDIAYITLKNAVIDNIINTIKKSQGYRALGETYGIENLTDDKLGYLILSSLTSIVRPSKPEFRGQARISSSEQSLALFEQAINHGITDLKTIGQGINANQRTFLLRALQDLSITSTIYNLASQWQGETGQSEQICLIPAIAYTLKTSICASLTKQAGEWKSQLLGDLLENLVISQCIIFCKGMSKGDLNYSTGFIRYELTKSDLERYNETNSTPEIDLAITITQQKGFSLTDKLILIEVKSSNSIKSSQLKNLNLESMNVPSGSLRYIIYLGDTQQIGNIQYINIYDFLSNLEHWLTP